MKIRSKGFSLIEMVVVCALLLVVMAVTFMLFRMGTRGFALGVMRAGSVGDIHAFSRMVGRDVSLTHLYSVSEEHRQVNTPDGTADRDGVCLAGLSNWSQDSNFHSVTGLPNWNRWVMIYATSEPVGRLIRLEMERPAPYYPLRPFDDLAAWMLDDLGGAPAPVRVNTLCQNVHAFRVEIAEQERLVKLRLLVKGQGPRRMTSQEKIDELLEARLEISPVNSYPDL